MPPGCRSAFVLLDTGRQALPDLGAPGAVGEAPLQQGLFMLSLRGWNSHRVCSRAGGGELGNLLGPQAGECNTRLQKYSVILALSLENSDVTGSQSASGRSCLLLLLQLAGEKLERGGGGGGREGETLGDTPTTYRQTQNAMEHGNTQAHTDRGPHGK